MNTFVYIKDYGWRLQLSSILDLAKYDDEIGIPRLKTSMENAIHNDIQTKQDEYLTAHCKATGEGWLHGSANVHSKCFDAKMKAIIRYGTIYVNEVGGWFMLQEHMKILKTVEVDSFKFPDVVYSETDIKVSKFRGGRHWYAKVGDFEVKDDSGDNKWNTEKYAYSVAKKFMDKINGTV